MIQPVILSTLTITPLRNVALDNRARQWVRDLELKGGNLAYLLHPDFEPGYHAGYQVCQAELADGDIPTVEGVINTIEHSLSHSLYDLYRRFAGVSDDDTSYPSYPYEVGFLFGWLTALLQTDAALDFPFLLAPVTDMHSYRASRCSSPYTGPRITGGDGWLLDM